MVGERDLTAFATQAPIPVLLGTIAVALGIAGVAGYLRYRHSLKRIGATLDAVASGNMGARIGRPILNDKLGRVMSDIDAALDRMQVLIQNLNNSSAEIAHTLKHPLLRLRHQLEQAEHGNIETDATDLLSSSISQIDAILASVDSILDVKQIESGHLRSRFIEVDLGSLMRKLVDVYEPVIEDAGQHLIVDITETKVAVLGLPDLLFQMMSNLVENAIRYCPPGTTIEIALTKQPSGGQRVVTIADDGPGLNSEERENVFVPFFRPESVRELAGHGIGIPLSAAIAKLHDTRVVLADNSPGLRISIAFPA